MRRIPLTVALLTLPTLGGSVFASQGSGCEPAWEPDVADFAVLNGRVEALTMFDDGTGPALYAGGQFTHAGDLEVNYIARWDGTQWSSVGGGVTEDALGVFALEVFDDGSGPALYVGGTFEQAGGQPFRNVARWTGSEWEDVGSGNDFEPIEDFAVFDDGHGDKLYAASYGFGAGWVVSAWNGIEWNQILEDVGTVYDLHVHDDGTGTKLYAAGNFEGPPGVDALNIARWDGTSWEALGDLFYESVYAMESMTMPDGEQLLYAGGRSEFANDQTTSVVASWNGVEWTPLFAPEASVTSSTGVRTLTAFNDGTGPALYIGGGLLLTHETILSIGIAKWTGTTFEALGNGGLRSGTVNTMLPSSMNQRPILIMGGGFSEVNFSFPADGSAFDSLNLAIWQGCALSDCDGDVTGDRSVDLADLNLVLANFGTQTDSGDTNSDGTVDLADLNAVLANFGNGC